MKSIFFQEGTFFYSEYLLQELTPSKWFVLIFCFNLFLPSKCPSHELIPTKRFLHSHYPSQTLSSQSVSCRELFPTIFFLSRKHPAENYSLQFFPFQEVSCRELFPTKFVLSLEVSCREIFPIFFPFQEVSCREIFPKKKSFGSIKHTKKSNFTSYRFFSLILAYETFREYRN